MHSEAEIKFKAEQIRNLLREALAALENPQVLDDVVAFALDNPQLAWEPVAIANYALHSHRCYQAKAAASGTLASTVKLINDPALTGGGLGGISLPKPRWEI